MIISNRGVSANSLNIHCLNDTFLKAFMLRKKSDSLQKRLVFGRTGFIYIHLGKKLSPKNWDCETLKLLQFSMSCYIR